MTDYLTQPEDGLALFNYHHDVVTRFAPMVAISLYTIREERLWKFHILPDGKRCTSWADYCDAVLGQTSNYTNKQIRGMTLLAALPDHVEDALTGEVVTIEKGALTEAHTRVLSGIPEHKRGEALVEATKLSRGGRMTARHIEEGYDVVRHRDLPDDPNNPHNIDRRTVLDSDYPEISKGMLAGRYTPPQARKLCAALDQCPQELVDDLMRIQMHHDPRTIRLMQELYDRKSDTYFAIVRSGRLDYPNGESVFAHNATYNNLTALMQALSREHAYHASVAASVERGEVPYEVRLVRRGSPELNAENVMRALLMPDIEAMIEVLKVYIERSKAEAHGV